MSAETVDVRDRVVALEEQYRGAFSRTPQSDGSVLVALSLANGDRVTGTGANTAAAVASLEKRCAAFHAALAEG